MKQKLKLKPGWIAVIGLVLVACVVRVVFSGYRFSAYIMFGCAGVISFYLLLPKLAKKKPKLAKVLAVGLSPA